jgi:alpha-1,3-glucosyltransferase
LAKVAVITILPFGLSFGPFIFAGGIDGIKQMFSRLFPFGRGLIHDYWAPNFWAFYFFADKIISFGLKIVFKYEPSLEIQAINSSHKALNTLKVLPEPSANMTLLLIILCLVPLIIHSIKAKKLNGLKIILINGLVFFMFGYHVHEKAISPYLHLCYVFIASDTEKSS